MKTMMARPWNLDYFWDNKKASHFSFGGYFPCFWHPHVKKYQEAPQSIQPKTALQEHLCLHCNNN
jgi:hypothetical protein